MDGLEAKIQKILSDPEALGSVLEMAKSLSGTEKPDAEPVSAETRTDPENPGGGLTNLLDGLDPATVGKVMGLMGEFTREDDKRTHLLKALKPYVRPERQSKMDRAAQIIKIARTANKALSSFGGDLHV